MTPEETLLKAADDIATHGHSKQTFYDRSATDWRTAPACAMGSIARVAELTEDRGLIGADGIDQLVASEATRRLAGQIRKDHPDFIRGLPHGSDAYDFITHFNDLPETTAEDVTLAMKKAAHDG